MMWQGAVAGGGWDPGHLAEGRKTRGRGPRNGRGSKWAPATPPATANYASKWLFYIIWLSGWYLYLHLLLPRVTWTWRVRT